MRHRQELWLFRLGLVLQIAYSAAYTIVHKKQYHVLSTANNTNPPGSSPTTVVQPKLAYPWSGCSLGVDNASASSASAPTKQPTAQLAQPRDLLARPVILTRPPLAPFPFPSVELLVTFGDTVVAKVDKIVSWLDAFLITDAGTVDRICGTGIVLTVLGWMVMGLFVRRYCIYDEVRIRNRKTQSWSSYRPQAGG